MGHSKIWILLASFLEYSTIFRPFEISNNLISNKKWWQNPGTSWINWPLSTNEKPQFLSRCWWRDKQRSVLFSSGVFLMPTPLFAIKFIVFTNAARTAIFDTMSYCYSIRYDPLLLCLTKYLKQRPKAYWNLIRIVLRKFQKDLKSQELISNLFLHQKSKQKFF